MKDMINYQNLWELQKDIDKQIEASPAFAFFNREKIRRFISQNQHRLSVLNKTMESIRNKYVKKDENGTLMTKEVDGKKLWDFASEEDEKKYLEEWNEFMQITFEVLI